MEIKEAVYWLNNLIGNYSDYYDNALEMGIKALEQQEIVRCGACIYYIPISNHWGKCSVNYQTCQICDYCSWAERRTDGKERSDNK